MYPHRHCSHPPERLRRTLTDIAAAARYARRRLGPFRAAPEREEHHERDLAALARAGFGCDVARRFIGVESPEEVEAGNGRRE